MLSIDYLLAGFYDWFNGGTTTVTKIAYLWTASRYTDRTAFDLKYNEEQLDVEGGRNYFGTGNGQVVRCNNPSTYLLSGSYGLAEGSGLTNAGTPVLAIEFVLAGTFGNTGAMPSAHANYGNYNTATSRNSNYRHRLFFSMLTLSAGNDSNSKGDGWSIRCQFLVNFATELYNDFFKIAL